MRHKTLVLGAAGSIGSELVKQLSKNSIVYVCDINETGVFDLIQDYGVLGRVGDIRDKETMKDVFSTFRPHTVYMAAAYKHVPLMEELPEEAVKTNVVGMLNVLRYSKMYEVKKFVFISSDKAVNPKTIMGGTKMLGELMTRNAGYTAVRFGNVLGSRGSLIPIWQKQIDKGKNITVTDPNCERYFMTIEEAVGLVIEAARIGKGGQIICLDMGKKVNILKLAKKFVKEENIDIIGLRPGEQLTEDIMSKEEQEVAIKKGKFYII